MQISMGIILSISNHVFSGTGGTGGPGDWGDRGDRGDNLELTIWSKTRNSETWTGETRETVGTLPVSRSPRYPSLAKNIKYIYALLLRHKMLFYF